MLRYYHYRKLSSRGRKAYEKIACAIKKYLSAAVIDTVSNLQIVIEAIKNDNPHFFYVEWGNVLYCSKMSEGKTVVYLKYAVSRPQAKKYLEEIKRIAVKLRANCEYSTMRKVHDYLASTVTYDPDVNVGKSFYRRNDHNVLGPLFDKVAVCEGISRAYQILLKILRIECTYMSGYVNTDTVKGNHAWNVVVFKGRMHKVDVTWDLSDGKKTHRYFMTPLSYFE